MAVLEDDVLHFPVLSHTPFGTTQGYFPVVETPHIWGVAVGHVHTHVDFPPTLWREPVHPGLLAHEAWHACREIAGGVGVAGVGVAGVGVAGVVLHVVGVGPWRTVPVIRKFEILKVDDARFPDVPHDSIGTHPCHCDE